MAENLGMTPEEMDEMTEQMEEAMSGEEGFELGGAETLTPFINNI